MPPISRGVGRPVLVILVALGALLGGFSSRAAAQSQEEARAIFLFNFAKFVEWPDFAFADGSTPITIAVVGNKEVARALERTVKGKDANGRDVVVKNLSTVDGCAEAHIVFVGDTKFADEVIGEIGGKPVLTVGEDETFIKQGGIIRLFSEGSKVMCMINVKGSEAAGLKLGDKLVKASTS